MYVQQKIITDQHITKGAESLHADFAPLVCEEDIFQSFVNHGVHFLQPWRKMTQKGERVSSRQISGGAKEREFDFVKLDE